MSAIALRASEKCQISLKATIVPNRPPVPLNPLTVAPIGYKRGHREKTFAMVEKRRIEKVANAKSMAIR